MLEFPGLRWVFFGVVSGWFRGAFYLGRPRAQKVSSMSVIVMHNKYNKQAKLSSKQVSQSASNQYTNEEQR